MSEKFERQLPTGIGGEKLKEDRETLPAVEVDNEVSWVNNNLDLPFDLKVGEPTSLGLFLTSKILISDSSFPIETSMGHSRSGLLGRVIFKDKQGNLYRDIDAKGLGYSTISYQEGEQKVGKVKKAESDGTARSTTGGWYTKGTLGILNDSLARRDIRFTREFMKAGIRTHQPIALIELKEIIDEFGNRVSVEEAKRKGILADTDEPVIELRAYGTRSRLNDVAQAKDPNVAEKLLSDAMAIVVQEKNLSLETFSKLDYLKWLIETTAINIARMHYKKWVHGFLTVHNISLDGRIVDLDSVENIKEHERNVDSKVVKSFEGDHDKAMESLMDFVFGSYPEHGLSDLPHWRYIVNDFDVMTGGVKVFFESAYKKEATVLKKRKTKQPKQVDEKIQ